MGLFDPVHWIGRLTQEVHYQIGPIHRYHEPRLTVLFGNLTVCLGKAPFFTGESFINIYKWAIFHSKLFNHKAPYISVAPILQELRESIDGKAGSWKPMTWR
jgi:hypothetical protein